MGVCYYLWRDDTREAYDLGKSWHWHEVFCSSRGWIMGRQEPMIVATKDESTLAELIVMAEQKYGNPLTADELAYLDWVASDIVRWTAGQPFEFVSENDARIEDAQMEGWDERPPRQRDYITGSRYRDARLPAH